MTITTGTADFRVGLETYKTWYKVVGDLKDGKRPVVALHGGPGMSHHYMLPHAELYTRAGMHMIFYDQIGNGESTHLRYAPAEFWTPELFMDELDNLLAHLGIAHNFDILGHSWGGMLAGQYAATRTPPGLKRLIIANAPCSIPLNAQGSSALLRASFPESFVSRIREHEEKGTTDSAEYQDAVMQFAKKHICTVDPWPVELVQSFEASEMDSTVYKSMIGVSEFNITGSLRAWDIIPILHRIACPTLLISAVNDSIQEIAVAPWFWKVPKIKWVRLEGSGTTHLAVFEEPERYCELLTDFLTLTPSTPSDAV